MSHSLGDGLQVGSRCEQRSHMGMPEAVKLDSRQLRFLEQWVPDPAGEVAASDRAAFPVRENQAGRVRSRGLPRPVLSKPPGQRTRGDQCCGGCALSSARQTPSCHRPGLACAESRGSQHSGPSPSIAGRGVLPAAPQSLPQARSELPGDAPAPSSRGSEPDLAQGSEIPSARHEAYPQHPGDSGESSRTSTHS